MNESIKPLNNNVKSALDVLAQQLRGPVHRSGESGYDAGRTVWNAMTDRRPAAVVSPSGEADIVDTVVAARDHDLLLSIRGGGHNVAGLAVCEGGLMLDLSHLREVRVDPHSRRVRVGPGATWGDVDRETQRHGMVVPGGIVSATGVAGLTLGGGFGWTCRQLGLTCDSLSAANVVTAAGETVRVSSDTEPDLFWALRGGGGNFGVVSSFEFEAHPVGPEVYAGMRWFPFERADEVVSAFAALTAQAPRELVSVLVLRKAPPAPFLPKSLQGQPAVAILVCYCGTPCQGPNAVAPLTALTGSVADTLGLHPFRRFQQVLDAGQPFGRRYYWKTHYFREWDDGIAEPLIEHASRVESPHSAVLFTHLGGAIGDVADHESAVGNRNAEYVINIQGAWEDDSEDSRHIGWTRAFWDALASWGSGQYVNFLTADADTAAIESAFGRERLQRLAGIKREWDPGNLFRMNHNIPPA